MKTLKNTMYKNIASILASDKTEFKTAQNLVLFSRVISTYPSKSIFCLVASRLIHFIEKNINSVSLILEIMKDEGEDEEIITNVEFLHNNPTIKTQAEVTRLCIILADYIKYSKILKVKDSFMTTFDMIDEEDDSNIKSNVDSLYKMATEIVNAYNASNIIETKHSFDTNDRDAMKHVVAEALDMRKPDKIIITGIRGLNQLLSPGYLSGCLYVYAGLPGNYKSGMLLESHIDTCKYNEHLKNSTNGKTPISMYISMENTMSQTVLRLWGILFPTADISMYTVDESTEMINNALTDRGIRSVILYYGYREKSTYDIAQIIRSYNTDDHQVVALYLDYIKRVRPGRTDAAAISSEKSELHTIMNELKAICTQENIAIVTGHQLNRAAASAVDAVVANGGYNKTDEAIGRSNIGTAWEVIEVADFLAMINIENNGETKSLMIKAVKQRDLDSKADNMFTAIRHPFLSPQSFALRCDIMENVSLSIPIYSGKHTTNFMANI